MVSIKVRSNGKTCVRSKLNFFDEKVVLTKDGFKQDDNGRRFQRDSSWHILYLDKLPNGDYEVEINGNEMKLLGFSWKEVSEEVYGEIEHDGTLPSRFKARVYNEGYRPDKKETWGILKKWWSSTGSMSDKEKANAINETVTTAKKKCR